MTTEEGSATSYLLDCPCGVTLDAASEDAIVESANAHLVAAHSGRMYTRDEILFIVRRQPRS